MFDARAELSSAWSWWWESRAWWCTWTWLWFGEGEEVVAALVLRRVALVVAEWALDAEELA